jgi:hypothetical protein
MTPYLSADLHAQGLLTTAEAPYIYDKHKVPVSNLTYWIKDGEPVF